MGDRDGGRDTVPSSAASGGPVLFVSYAREDKELCRRLVLMLGLVLKGRGYDVWWDEAHVAGPWRDQIEASLQRAVAGVVLVSEHSLASTFVMDEELPRLLARGSVAPVYGRPCPWQSVNEIAALQFLGSTEKALAELDDTRGELAAALSAVASQAPDFLGLRPVATVSGRPGVPTSADLAEAGTDPVAGSEQLGELHGVPELPEGYFERTTDLDGLRSRLLAGGGGAVGDGRGRAFGVFGAGGIGKTVIATAMARDATVRRAFSEGVYWVVMGEHPDLVAVQIALADLIGLDVAIRTVEEGRDMLREALRDRRVLIVVDDVWSAADAEALMVAGPRAQFVLTTRHALVLDRIRAERIGVDRLGLPEARRFLGQITGGAASLPDEADQLIEDVGGVVLALALVGATILHGRSWADAVAEVGDAGGFLEDESFANQFKAMRVAWGALDDPTRSLYRDLVVFGQDVAVPIVTVARLWSHTAGLDARETERTCSELAQRNLLVYEGSIRFHQMQRAFLQLHTPDSALAHGRLIEAHADVPVIPRRWHSLPDDEPYLWNHLIEHLVAAGNVSGLEATLVDPVWLVRRYHLQGPHAPEADLERGLEALPTYRRGAQVLHRMRQVSHVLAAVTTLGDRALTFAHHVSDLVPVGDLGRYFPPARLTPDHSLSEAPDGLERVVTGHAAGVWSVVWSPDGRRMASGSLDGTLRVWETGVAGGQAAVLGGHAGPLRSVAWSSDGRRLASGGDDGTVRVWDMDAPGTPATEMVGHEGTVWSVAWSPDGRRVASAGSDGTVRLWEPDHPDRRLTVLRGHSGTVWSVAWSPDGRRIASGGADRSVQMWAADAPTEPPVQLGCHDGWAWSVAWSPDGRRLVSGGDRTVRVWDVEAPGNPTTMLAGHDGLVWSVAWSPTGGQLASGSADGTVRVWDSNDAAEFLVLAAHEEHVWSVAWSPDGHRLASGANDETVRLWEIGTGGRSPDPVVSPGHWVWSVAWSPDGRHLATGTEDGAIRIWKPAASGTPPVEVATVDGGIWAVAWSPDGLWFAAGGADRVVRLWTHPHWEAPPVPLIGHRGLVRSLAWSPDSRRLASTSDDGTLRIWEPMEPARPVAVLTREDGEVRSRSVAWSPEGRRLASGHDDGCLRIWLPEGSRQRPSMRAGHRGRVESVRWSPDGRLVATAGLDGTVQVWDMEEITRPPTFIGSHDGPANAVAWSRDGAWLISGGEDRTVRMWEVSSGMPAVTLGVGRVVCSLAWDGDRIAVGMVRSWTLLIVEGT